MANVKEIKEKKRKKKPFTREIFSLKVPSYICGRVLNTLLEPPPKF